MAKIVITNCWFGKYPIYFPFWLKSAAANHDIDFMIFTDQPKPPKSPENVIFKNLSFEALAAKIRQKLNRPDIILHNPYKICDYRPFFGLIFDEEFAPYEFWGYCDLDLFLGRLRSFITPEILAKYDKIYPMGHLSLYRNTRACNRRILLPGAKFAQDDVLTRTANFSYDEWPGIYAIYKKHNFPLYEKAQYADISCFRRRFSLQSRKSDKYPKPAADYKNQVFFWENGEVHRAYYADGRINYDKFVYIHLFKRKMLEPDFAAHTAEAFFITPAGLVAKTPGAGVTLAEIKKLNPHYGKIYEYFEYKIKRRRLKKQNHKVFAPRHLRQNIS